MRLRHSASCLVVRSVLLLSLLAACQSETAPPDPTLTPRPPPLPGPETLLDQATELCRNMPQELLQTQFVLPDLHLPSRSLLSLRLSDREDEQPVWRYAPLHMPQVDAIAAPEVGYVLCARELREQRGTFSDGEALYLLSVNVAVYRWDNGEVVLQGTYQAEMPRPSGGALQKWHTGPMYISADTASLRAWLYDAFCDRTLLWHSGAPVVSVALSPDAQLVATLVGGGSPSDVVPAWRDGDVTLWDTASGGIVHTFHRNDDRFFLQDGALAFSPDGGYLAAVTSPVRIEVWSVASYESVHRFTTDSACTSLAFAPDGTMLAAGFESGEVQIWRTSDWVLLRSLEPHSGTVNVVAFSPVDGVLASGGVDRLSLSSITTGESLATCPGCVGHVTILAFSADGKRLATTGSGQITFRDGTTFDKLAEVRSRSDTWEAQVCITTGLALSPDGTVLAAGCTFDQTQSRSQPASERLRGEDVYPITLIDPTRTSADSVIPAVLAVLPGHTDDVTDLAFAPDGSLLASASKDGSVRLWTLADWY